MRKNHTTIPNFQSVDAPIETKTSFELIGELVSKEQRGKAFVFRNGDRCQFNLVSFSTLFGTKSQDVCYQVYYNELGSCDTIHLGQLESSSVMINGGRTLMFNCEGDSSPLLISLNPMTGLLEVRYRISRLTVTLGMVFVVASRLHSERYTELKTRCELMQQVTRLRWLQVNQVLSDIRLKTSEMIK